jgi:hypothetical protein
MISMASNKIKNAGALADAMLAGSSFFAAWRRSRLAGISFMDGGTNLLSLPRNYWCPLFLSVRD